MRIKSVGNIIRMIFAFGRKSVGIKRRLHDNDMFITDVSYRLINSSVEFMESVEFLFPVRNAMQGSVEQVITCNRRLVLIMSGNLSPESYNIVSCIERDCCSSGESADFFRK